MCSFFKNNSTERCSRRLRLENVGGSRGGAWGARSPHSPNPLFLDQTEARRGKIFFKITNVKITCITSPIRDTE